MAEWQMLGLIGGLIALVVVLSAAAGALWWRVRSRPIVEAAHLASVLATRLQKLDALLERLEDKGRARSGDLFAGQPFGKNRRFDPAPPSPVNGPTLITVPDLAAHEAGEVGPSAVAVELGKRFGAIWALADSGATPETIARGTGQPIGQVELILGLRRQLESAAAIGGGSRS